MIRILLTIILSVQVAQTALGQNGQVQYVRDTLYVVLRSLPADDAEILHSGLVSGTPLTVLGVSDDGEYSLVRTQDEQEGWLQTQYLSEQPAARDQLARIQTAMSQDETQQLQLQESFDQLASEYQSTLAALTDLTEQHAMLQAELEEVLSLSGNAVALDNTNSELQAANAQLSNTIQNQQVEIAVLQSEAENTTFWRGVIAVLIGIGITLLIALMWPKKKSEWA